MVSQGVPVVGVTGFELVPDRPLTCGDAAPPALMVEVCGINEHCIPFRYCPILPGGKARQVTSQYRPVRRHKPRRTWGSIRKRPSGRYEATHTGPDGRRHRGPYLYDTVVTAEAWLATQRVSMASQDWTAPSRPKAATLTFTDYATEWLSQRDLKARSRAECRSLLDRLILPDLGERSLSSIDSETVRSWYARTALDTPTQRAHAYSLLRSVLTTAVDEELLLVNPCRVRGAGVVKSARRIEPASLDELAIIARSVPARYQALILLTARCGLRFGEVTELRRRDVDLKGGRVRIRRGVVRVNCEVIVGSPKSAAGIRDVAVPPHLLPMLSAHLAAHAADVPDALLFSAAGSPTAHLAPATLYRVFYPARDAAGRPDLRFHDLRHTGAVLAAATGATLAELMARLGHSTPAAAMRYQHAAADRDQAIAEALSRLACGSAASGTRRSRK